MLSGRVVAMQVRLAVSLAGNSSRGKEEGEESVLQERGGDGGGEQENYGAHKASTESTEWIGQLQAC